MSVPKAAASVGDADDDEGDNGAGAAAAAAEGGCVCGGGGERVEGGRELRSGMAGPPEPSFLFLSISQIFAGVCISVVLRRSIFFDV